MISFQYFEGCPNAAKTLNNLREALQEMKIPENELEIIKVHNSSEAKKLKFQGSPTVLIDGVDIYSMNMPEGYSYSCRVYHMNGLQTGIIPTYFIKERIEQFYSDR